MSEELDHTQYTIRRRALTLVGAKFEVIDSKGKVVLFSRQKAFKLKEDIRVYADESESKERLMIRARDIIDFAAAYYVVDPATGAHIGVLRRKGLSSLLRDSWEILGPDEQPLAQLREDSVVLALLRRFIGIIPQTLHARANGVSLVTYKQNLIPLVQKLNVTIHQSGVIDPRLALAAGILLLAIEGRQG